MGRSSELRQLLKDSQFRAFAKAIDWAVKELVQAVLIAGDLFDNDRLSLTTERFLLEQIQRLEKSKIPCVYVTGNHDPGAKGFRARSIDWPPNFYLLGEPQPREIEILDDRGKPLAIVVGAGHDNPSEDRNLVPLFPDCQKPGIPTVGLLHTYVTTAKSAEQHDRYAPCSSEDLASKDYDYWALGHVHAHQQVIGADDAWYPGILQGRNPGETGLKGGLAVSIPDRGAPAVEFQPFSEVIWQTLILNQLSEVGNLSDFRNLTVKAYEELREVTPSARDWMLRIELEGPCPLTDLLRDRNEVESLEEDLRAFLDVSFVEIRARRLAPFWNIDSYRGDVHVISEILSYIESLEKDAHLLEEVSPRLLAGPVDEFGSKTRYLKELLAGLEFEAVDRLVDATDAHQ